jgi:uncharacterized phage protein gp47/JayE
VVYLRNIDRRTISAQSALGRCIKEGKMAAKESIYQSQISAEIKKIPAEYLSSLLAMIRAFREGVTLKTAEESFRQGWKEALRGETHPISELWEGIDAE